MVATFYPPQKIYNPDWDELEDQSMSEEPEPEFVTVATANVEERYD